MTPNTVKFMAGVAVTTDPPWAAKDLISSFYGTMVIGSATKVIVSPDWKP